jgi:hypothetical protein
MRVSILLLTLSLPVAQPEELEMRAREIVRRNQEAEITITEARRQVQLLLKDLKAWSKSADVGLETRTAVFASPATAPGEVLTVDRCPLFHEESLKRLCPLDVSHSEVWGASVVFCRYECAPAKE